MSVFLICKIMKSKKADRQYKDENVYTWKCQALVKFTGCCLLLNRPVLQRHLWDTELLTRNSPRYWDCLFELPLSYRVRRRLRAGAGWVLQRASNVPLLVILNLAGVLISQRMMAEATHQLTWCRVRYCRVVWDSDSLGFIYWHHHWEFITCQLLS